MQDIRGRFSVEPQWPQGGFMTRPIGERRYEVQAFTGRSVSTVGAGQWARGELVRTETPVFRPNPSGLYMYDPTNPMLHAPVYN